MLAENSSSEDLDGEPTECFSARNQKAEVSTNVALHRSGLVLRKIEETLGECARLEGVGERLKADSKRLDDKYASILSAK